MHIRWCPTGPFTFLPIHAAGEYKEDGSSSKCLFDYAISSYIPSLGSLIASQQDTTFTIQPKSQIFAVVQPQTPNLPALPGTLKELTLLRGRAHEHNVEVKALVGDEATPTTVKNTMGDYSIVHFACHGIQDRQSPLDSGLALKDGLLKLSDLMYTKLPNARIAFLSACQTAMGDSKQPDEAIHISAGMLAAGFRSVVGTMWSVYDHAAPIVADRFYARLLKNGDIRDGKSAEALHYAIQDLRETFPEFMSWLPFIHIGM